MMILTASKSPIHVPVAFQHEAFTWHNVYPGLVWIGVGLLCVILGGAIGRATGGRAGGAFLLIGILLIVTFVGIGIDIFR